ncbi:hypothetical protein DL765_001401 [Monosporascus sp. GIB2]|nr:hypothetical protein DL765_001401 [Monosporascus sp. GIB2]
MASTLAMRIDDVAVNRDTVETMAADVIRQQAEIRDYQRKMKLLQTTFAKIDASKARGFDIAIFHLNRP